jgi:ParB family chromosome partitioning protein
MESKAQERFEQLPLAALRESARNTRRTFNEGRMAELTESIRQKGVISPLIARPVEGKVPSYEIAAGHRRFRAAQLAGLDSVPVIIRQYSDEDFLEVLTVENLQREDVHPMEEAEGYAELLKRPGYDVSLLAQKVGKSDSYVYQRLKLLELVPELREQFASEKIHFGHALILCRLQPATQLDLAHHDLHDRRDGLISVQGLRNVVERDVYLDLGKAAFPISDAGLVSKAGSCDACAKRTGFNPSLFPEVKAKDNCLDRACYHEKANAFASRQTAKLTKELGVKPLAISSASKYNTDKKAGVLHEDDWRQVKNGAECSSTKKAVVVELSRHGDEKHRLGDILCVCTNKQCQDHWRSMYTPTPRAERSAADLKLELAAKEKTETMEAADVALLEAALADVAYPFELEELRAIARVMWARLYHDHRLKVLARRGLKQQTTRDGTREDVLRIAIRTMTTHEVAALMVEIAVTEDHSVSEGDTRVIDLALDCVPAARRTAIYGAAAAKVKDAYDAKRARIDKAEAKKLEAAKAAKAAEKAATKNQPAAKKAVPAKKGKAKK